MQLSIASSQQCCTAQIGRASSRSVRWLLKACRSVAQALEHEGNGGRPLETKKQHQEGPKRRREPKLSSGSAPHPAGVPASDPAGLPPWTHGRAPGAPPGAIFVFPARRTPRITATWLARGAAHPGHHGRCRGPGCGYHGDAPGGPDPPRSRATVPLTWVGPVLLGTMRIHRKQDTHRYKIQDLEHVHRIFMVRSPNFPT